MTGTLDTSSLTDTAFCDCRLENYGLAFRRSLLNCRTPLRSLLSEAVLTKDVEQIWKEVGSERRNFSKLRTRRIRYRDRRRFGYWHIIDPIPHKNPVLGRQPIFP